MPELNIAKKLDGGSYSHYYFARFQWSINNVNINKPKIVKKGVNLGALSSPFTKDELKALYSTQVLTDPGSRLRVDLAVQTGLRVREITGFTAGKYDKERGIMVSKNLMQSLCDYRNSPEHQYRLEKWKLTTGSCKDAPLFLNRAGERMSSQSVSNVISQARDELVKQGIVLRGSFHDLRRTFAINYAGFLSSKNLQIDSIKLWSAHLLVHSHSSATQQYIKSSDSLIFDELSDEFVISPQKTASSVQGQPILHGFCKKE